MCLYKSFVVQYLVHCAVRLLSEWQDNCPRNPIANRQDCKRLCQTACICFVSNCFQCSLSFLFLFGIFQLFSIFSYLLVFVFNFPAFFNVFWFVCFRFQFSSFFQCFLICLFSFSISTFFQCTLISLFSFSIFQLSQPLLLNCRDESKLQSCCNCMAIPSDSNACTEMFIILLRNICSGNENCWSASYSEILKV